MQMPMARYVPVWDLYQLLPIWVRSNVVRVRHQEIWNAIPGNVPAVIVHIPKTGGTTLATLLYGHAVNHYPIWVWRMANQRRFEQSAIVTVLREPLDRLGSAIRHCLGGERASQRDLAAGQFFRRNGTSVREMVECYLRDASIRRELSNNLLFKPYGFWLGQRELIPRLRCFALTTGRNGQSTESGLRLNFNRNVEMFTGITDNHRLLAQRILWDDYAWYDDPRNEEIVDINEIPGRLHREEMDKY
jgi:hypothetical protein